MTAVADDVQWILERERVNGGPFWSRADGNIHAPARFFTLLVLNVLGELGATRLTHPLIADAAEFVSGYQCDDGAFRYTPGGSKLACIAGQALAGLGRLGAAGGERAEAGFRWLLDSQRGDGGWRCPMVRLGASPQTDASNPGATLFVLDAFRFRRNSPADGAALRSGVDSLLRHWQTRVPLGPCRFGIGSRFLAVEYPFWRYNLFYYVYVLAHYPQARADSRFAAVRRLSAHVDAAGEMVVDAPARAWQGRSLPARTHPASWRPDAGGRSRPCSAKTMDPRTQRRYVADGKGAIAPDRPALPASADGIRALHTRSERRFTCVTQFIRQRRSVTGGVTAFHRPPADICR